MINCVDEQGNNDSYFSIREVSKLVGLKDKKGKLIGRNKFITLLKNNKVILKDGTLSQSFLSLGLGIYHLTEKVKSNRTFGVCMFSSRGIAFLKKQFETGKYVINTQKTKPNYSEIF